MKAINSTPDVDTGQVYSSGPNHQTWSNATKLLVRENARTCAAFFSMLFTVLFLPSMALAQETIVAAPIVAGDGSLSPDSPTIDGSPATSVRFEANHGLYVDDKSIYAPSGNYYGNGRVSRVDIATGLLYRFAGTGMGGLIALDGTPALDAPVDWAIDAVKDDDGNVYISSFGGMRIQKIDPDGKFFHVAGGGSAALGTENVQAKDVSLLYPYGLAYRDGSLYFSEWATGRIRRIDLATGIITTYAGNPSFGYALPDPIPDAMNPPDAYGFKIGDAQAIAFDSTGTLYFRSNGWGYIRKITPDGKLHDVASPNGTFALTAATAGDAVGMSTLDLKMDGYANGMTVDSLDNLYFMWGSRRIVIAGSDGIVSHVLYLPNSYQQAIAVAPNGDIYLASAGLVSRIEAIIAPNTDSPPIANAGADQSIRAGDTVYLDGGDSFDDNTMSENLEYLWTLSTPEGSTATLSGAATATPSFVADVAGTFVVQLVVTDEGDLASEPAFVEVSTENLAPTAVATVDYSLAIVGDASIFDGSGSSDPEDDPLAYSWTITDAPAASTAALVGDNTKTPTLTTDLEGEYDVELTVSDFIGPGSPATVSLVAVTPVNFAELQIIDACDLAEALRPDQVTTRGNQIAFCNFLSQAISEIQKGKVDKAIAKLNQAIERTDGCPLRGSEDGNGPGRDWITDCEVQATIHEQLTSAVDALQN